MFRRLCIFAFVPLLFLIHVPNVSASVVYRQTDFTMVSTSTTAGWVSQTLGQGFNGYLTGIYAYLKGDANGSGVKFVIFECTDSAYTSCNGGTTVTTSSTDYATASSSAEVTGELATASIYMDVSKYYYFRVDSASLYNAGNNGGAFNFYGTDENSYSNGYCDNVHSFDNTICGSMDDLAFWVMSGSSSPPEFPSNETRFTDLEPSADQVVATSTVFVIGASGYVSPDDWEEGTMLKLSFSQTTGENFTGTAIMNWDNVDGGYEEELFVGNFFSSEVFSITNAGVYTVVASIDKPKFSVFGFEVPYFREELARVVWQFTAATSTEEERRNAALILDFAGLDAQTVASSTVSANFCNFYGFDMGQCILHLFIPTQDKMLDFWEEFRDSILTKFPLGYITRFVTIMWGGVEPVQPPPISYSFGSSAPQAFQDLTNGDPIEFQIFDHFDVVNEIRSDQDDTTTLWDVVDPVVKLLVSMAILVVILGDMSMFQFNSSSKPDRQGPDNAERMYRSTITSDLRSPRKYGGVK